MAIKKFKMIAESTGNEFKSKKKRLSAKTKEKNCVGQPAWDFQSMLDASYSYHIL